MPLQLAPLLNRQRNETRRTENQRTTTRTEVAARQPHTRAARKFGTTLSASKVNSRTVAR